MMRLRREPGLGCADHPHLAFGVWRSGVTWPHLALKLITSGMLTFDERVEVHRVAAARITLTYRGEICHTETELSYGN